MKKFQVFVLFLLFVSLVFGEDVDTENTKVFTECSSELSISEDVPKHFKEHGGELPEDSDQKVKCFFHCVAKKYNLTDETGNINAEKSIEFVSTHYPVPDEEKLNSIVNSCSERSETDVCEKWYEFSKCQLKKFTALEPAKEE